MPFHNLNFLCARLKAIANLWASSRTLINKILLSFTHCFILAESVTTKKNYYVCVLRLWRYRQLAYASQLRVILILLYLPVASHHQSKNIWHRPFSVFQSTFQHFRQTVHIALLLHRFYFKFTVLTFTGPVSSKTTMLPTLSLAPKLEIS